MWVISLHKVAQANQYVIYVGNSYRSPFVDLVMNTMSHTYWYGACEHRYKDSGHSLSDHTYVFCTWQKTISPTKTWVLGYLPPEIPFDFSTNHWKGRPMSNTEFRLMLTAPPNSRPNIYYGKMWIAISFVKLYEIWCTCIPTYYSGCCFRSVFN